MLKELINSESFQELTVNQIKLQLDYFLNNKITFDLVINNKEILTYPYIHKNFFKEDFRMFKFKEYSELTMFLSEYDFCFNAKIFDTHTFFKINYNSISKIIIGEVEIFNNICIDSMNKIGISELNKEKSLQKFKNNNSNIGKFNIRD